MKRGFVWLLAAVATLSGNAFAADLLAPGATAPKLDVRTWVKGAAVKQFEPGKTYVVEFWATWCGPCFESIPLLTDFAKKHPDVSVLGISVFEENKNKAVEAFVAKMGDRMDYTVAYSGNEDKMAKSWMKAAKQSGIPTAFVVKDRKIVWIGSPFSLEKEFERIEKSDFDVVAERANFEKLVATREKTLMIDAEIESISKLFDSGKRKEAHDRLDKESEEPLAKGAVARLRFQWLAYEDQEEFKKICLERIAKNDSQRGRLSFFAYEHAAKNPGISKWIISETTKPDQKPDWYPFLNGARAYFVMKEYDLALDMAAKSRKVIEDYQKANPDLPKGNALEVIDELVAKINKAKSGK